MYPFGVRVPAGMDEFAAKYGITMGESWHEYLVQSSTNLEELEHFFNELDADGNGFIEHQEADKGHRHSTYATCSCRTVPW